MKNAFSGAIKADDDYFPTADGVKGEDSSLTYRFQRWEMTIPSIFRRGKQGVFVNTVKYAG